MSPIGPAMPNPSNPYLLIARVGRNSLHSEWLTSASGRRFDVLLSAYDARVADPGLDNMWFEHRPGSKVAGYAALFDAHADHIKQYDHVAVFDDDLSIDGDALNRLFAIIHEHDFKIAQPALTTASHFTYACLLRDPAFRLRHVNYVEMMCPVFSQSTFQAIRPLYAMGYESGIDLVWCNLVAAAPTDFAVIDDVPVWHTRPVGAAKAANGFTGGKCYEDDIYAVLDRFRLPWLSCVPYSGVRRDGVLEQRRWKFLLSALRLVFVIGSGAGPRQRARSVAVYWKHLLQRRARNINVILQAERGLGD
ncbi:DUF707 domain-containing protein [Sphingomonas sp.]|uniref:DUF707 domain-containing protein n=1 Tax=Sphingomonas sp. TaxID=28214 RepID=UPI0025F42DB8|nr:DUF707 domain-containing protein [Sphingomonas sp.]